VADAVSNPVIQRIAPGLVGFLQIKNLGRGNPLSLNEALNPTWPTRDQYFASALEHVVGTNTVNAIGISGPTNTATTSPADEYWWIDGFTVFGGTIAAEAISVQPVAVFIPAGAQQFIGLPHSVAASSRFGTFASLPRFIPPNTALQAMVNSITTAGTITLNFAASIVRLKA